MILNHIVTHFENSVREKGILSEEDIEKMAYGMQVILSECVKIILMSIFFAILGLLPEFLFAFTLLASIRSYSGGLHFYTWLKCFVFSFAFFIIAILVLPNISYINKDSIYVILSISSLIITFIFAPMTSKHRPIRDRKRIFHSKVIALSITLVWLIIMLVFFQHSNLLSIGIWIITLQNTQLLISGGIQDEKND